jgi:hypothetical protein
MITKIKKAWRVLVNEDVVEKLLADNVTLLNERHAERMANEATIAAMIQEHSAEMHEARDRESDLYKINFDNLSRLNDQHRRELELIESERTKTDYEVMCRLSDLKTALDKAEKERDYFRARADRIELELLGRRTPATPGQPRRIVNTGPIGRTRWQQVQAEAAARNAELDRQEAEARKAAEEGQAAPQPEAGETKAS